MKRFVNIALYLVFIYGIFGAGNLAYSQFITKNSCPEILGIPACYIILICLVIPFIVHVFKGNKTIYFLFTGVAFIIATYATTVQLLEIQQCPKTENGIPMCYFSLLIFMLLISLKLALNYLEKKEKHNFMT